MMSYEEIIEQLNSTKRTSFGISIPELRKLAKKIAKENFKDFLIRNTNETFEQRLLHAFVIGYIKDDINNLIKYFEDFIPFVNDWGINDSLCQNFTITRNYRELIYQKIILKYKNSKNEFESRIVAVLLLSHYLCDKYIETVIQILDKLNTDDYYSQMGVAWAIATVMGKYPDKCIDYLKSPQNNLDKVTYNKSIQKICESLRVKPETKKVCKSLKKPN